jgi:hypothetical protein
MGTLQLKATCSDSRLHENGHQFVTYFKELQRRDYSDNKCDHRDAS